MKKLDIIYEDKEILVVNKPAGLLTISDGKSLHTLYSMAREYVKKQHKSNKIFIVHRLDKDTSGVVILAKNEKMKEYLQSNWANITNREYIAILNGRLENKEGKIEEYLKEDKNHFVYASKDKRGELAITLYEVMGYDKNKTIVKVKIITGKKNQIRVGFSNLGYPVIGDKKYGIKDGFRRLGLHAFKLEVLIHNQKLCFEAKMPKELASFMSKKEKF